MDSNVDESLIEATIRRVAEAQAARDGTDASDTPTEQPDTPETPAAEVPDGAVVGDATKSPSARAQDEAPDAPVPAQLATPPIANESEIEATIRRVAAATAKRAEPSAAAAADLPEDETRTASAREPEAPLTFAQRGHAATAVAFEPVSQPQPSAAVLGRIEQSLDSVHALLRQIIERLDGTGSAVGTTRPSLVASMPDNVSDDEWEDEAPALQTMAFGAPPRPSILRDPPARASAPPAIADDMDARPLPAPLPPLQPDTRRGFDLLPRTYRITVEDKRRGVDLVPLHRALLAMDGVRDMSLLSYNNGVAIVSLETVSDIDTDVLGRAVSRAMSRGATVETHNDRTLVVKLAED